MNQYIQIDLLETVKDENIMKQFTRKPSGLKTIPCAYCKVEFKQKFKHSKYCGRECWIKVASMPRKPRIEKECPNCCKTFIICADKAQIFCSRQCARASKRPKMPIVKTISAARWKRELEKAKHNRRSDIFELLATYQFNHLIK